MQRGEGGSRRDPSLRSGRQFKRVTPHGRPDAARAVQPGLRGCAGETPSRAGPCRSRTRSTKAGLRKVISRPLISPVKSPRRRNSTGPIAAKVIRPATRPDVRLSRNPSWTHRPLLNFCATRSIRNELPLVLLDPDPLARLELLHIFLLKQLHVAFDALRLVDPVLLHHPVGKLEFPQQHRHVREPPSTKDLRFLQLGKAIRRLPKGTR